MEVNLTLIPDSEPNRLNVTLPEGTVDVVGTPGFVIGVLRGLLMPGSVVHTLIIEHHKFDELYEMWRKAASEAGLEL